jgi:hypothetical protein
MFRHITGKKNQQPKHPKVAHQDYIYIDRKPFNDALVDIPESELEQRISIHDMRRALRRTAEKIRALYAAKGTSHKPDRLAKMRLAKPKRQWAQQLSS